MWTYTMEEYDAYDLEETRRRLAEEREEFEQLIDDAQQQE